MEVKSTRQFRKRLADILDYASINFGQKTVRNWQVCLEKMLNALRSNPERYPFALEILDIQPNAHGVIMRKTSRLFLSIVQESKLCNLLTFGICDKILMS